MDPARENQFIKNFESIIKLPANGIRTQIETIISLYGIQRKDVMKLYINDNNVVITSWQKFLYSPMISVQQYLSIYWRVCILTKIVDPDKIIPMTGVTPPKIDDIINLNNTWPTEYANLMKKQNPPPVPHAGPPPPPPPPPAGGKKNNNLITVAIPI
jgi:hypothetical protein